jgi:hypothetical protein
LSNITLALLTALISVLGVAGPSIYKLVHKPRSDAYLVNLAVDGTRIRVTAINWGDAPAVLGEAFVDSEYLAPATKVRLRSDGAALLPPGTSLISFDVIPLLDEGQSYAASLDAMTRMLAQKKKVEEVSKIRFRVMQSDGVEQINDLRLTDSDLFQVFRANADRCSGVAKPNFDNGCIGPGDEKHGRYDVSGPRLTDDNKIVD